MVPSLPSKNVLIASGTGAGLRVSGPGQAQFSFPDVGTWRVDGEVAGMQLEELLVAPSPTCSATPRLDTIRLYTPSTADRERASISCHTTVDQARWRYYTYLAATRR